MTMDDPLLAARRALEGTIFVEAALHPDGVGLIFSTQDRKLRLNADAVGGRETPVPDDARLPELTARLVELVMPLFGLKVADLRRREDNAYLLVFKSGQELSLFRSSDDNITDNVASLHGPGLDVFLE